MSQTTKWKYHTCSCWFKPTKKRGLFGDTIEEGYWAFKIRDHDKEYSLYDGLNYMGDLGYELVAVQQSWAVHGGEIAGGYYPWYLYIFKKPREAQCNSDKTQDSSISESGCAT